jgi:integrase
MTVDLLESFRAGREIRPITSSKELQTFRQFFGFCFDRRWISENIAKRVKGPRNIKPNDIEPYTSSEVSSILAACDTFGRGPYERARARGMILLLRYTVLRIGDVAVLVRDRVGWDAERERWRIFIRTEKTGSPVFLPIPGELKQTTPSRSIFSGTARPGSEPQLAARSARLSAVFKKSGVKDAHAHRFRHTWPPNSWARRQLRGHC